MRAPNRILDLDELETPAFRQVLDRMDELTGSDSISYLHPSKRWEYPWALERARLSPGARVLDAGCGASIFPVYLAEQGYRVSALDLSPPPGLDRVHGVSVGYVGGDLGRLPFVDGAFDAVFCISVIEHLGFGAMAAALSEMHRVIRANGRLLLTTDYYEDANASIRYEGEGGPFPVEWSFFDAERLKQHILEAPGWRLEGELDLRVDWERTKPVMRRFHGYPYTSVGVTLVRV
ncbi:class I SAM-dependent methyltransferase [Thiohalomonas denitrificans]|uniref:class I SAM-dependent methyltransferase n=1 Tax=Thiohalomonas denitrificans TaxID=415747 RepID=UPI0026F348D2|nr:class I SAM-dependent methyltransferase [Thiohalomonas denitrificans]